MRSCTYEQRSLSATEKASDTDSDIEILDDAPARPAKPDSAVSSTSTSASKPSSRKKWTTNDLPAGAQDDERWGSLFIPTLLRYQGCSHDPWTCDPARSVAVIQKIWDRVYGQNLPHRVVLNDNVYKVVSLRPLRPRCV